MSEVVELLKALKYEEIRSDPIAPQDYPAMVEEQLGVSLPIDYRKFLRAYPRSGGPGHSVLIRPLDDDDCTDISWMELHGFEEGENRGLIGVNRDYPDNHIPGAIVIGDDILGNFLYMTVTGDDPGSVYFYDRDERSSGTLDDLIRLSTSFSNFLQRTIIDPDD